MESNNELKETNNKNHTDYYFDDVANINDLDSNRFHWTKHHIKIF